MDGRVERDDNINVVEFCDLPRELRMRDFHKKDAIRRKKTFLAQISPSSVNNICCSPMFFVSMLFIS